MAARRRRPRQQRPLRPADPLVSLLPHTICFLLLLLLLLAASPPPTALAAHSRRRPTTSVPSSRGSPDEYDRSITTFSDDGRLLQVEYGFVASARGGTVACLDLDCLARRHRRSSSSSLPTLGKGILLAVAAADGGGGGSSSTTLSSSSSTTPILPTNTATNDKVHRIDDHALLVTSGLNGDSRALAHTVRLACQRLRLSYGEAPTLAEIARVVGGTQHELTRVGGARPFGVSAVLVGVDPLPDMDRVEDEYERDCVDDEDEKEEGRPRHAAAPPSSSTKIPGVPQLYRTEPGGSVDRCDYCSVGRNWERAARSLEALRDKYAKGELLKTTAGDAAEEGEGAGNEGLGAVLAGVVRAVASAVLDAAAADDRNSSGGGIGSGDEEVATTEGGEDGVDGSRDDGGGRRAVDLWLIRASPTRRGGAAILAARGVTREGLDEAAARLAGGAGALI